MGRTISDQVRDIIRDRGMSGYELAAAAGVARSQVNRFLAGGTMTLETLDAIAEVLKLHVGVIARRGLNRKAAAKNSPPTVLPGSTDGAP